MATRITKFFDLKNNPYLIDLIFENARAGLRAEASRGYLGMLWWVIEPVMYMSVFYFVFSHLYKRGDENYVLFLLTGLTVWKWVQSTINTGATCLLAGAGLMNQVYLPKIVFPLTAVAVNTFKFLCVLSLFLILLQFTPARLTLVWIFLPILVLTQLFLITSITCLMAAVMPFFPDFKFILNNILIMLFFLSGIIFDISSSPEAIQKILILNPLAALIQMFRMLLLKGLTPDWYEVFLINIFSFVVFFVALAIFRKFDRIYPKIIY